MNTYVDSLKSRRFRDSLLSSISRHNDPPPSTDDSSMTRSEQGFLPHTGKVIRHIRYRRVKVFGPRNINDTTFTTSMKLIHLANRLHFDSEEWMIRQSLFFRQKDTVNAYELADNERYLRNRPFLSDARILTMETGYEDSVDIEVLTKDVFEYGFDLRELTPTVAAARVFSNNLFGAGQGVTLGFRWDNSYARPWGTQAQYTKYNVLGTFTDVTLGYSELNTQVPLDTGVYEGSYFIQVQRPLYRSSARFAGGFALARNYSINIRGYADSVFRDYAYKTLDVWTGYSFRNRISNSGHLVHKSSMALLVRYNNLRFDKTPHQAEYIGDPTYNNRHYYLGQFLLFRQDFFKTHRFFGFGRTEDIPYGYSASITGGWENWMDRRRLYTAMELQKYWHTRLNGLLSLNVGLGSFWQGNVSEDMVIHANVSYYSKLMPLWKGHWRQFLSADYLGNPNNYFYKPLNLNMENGIWGFKNTAISGYHRLNLRAESVFYSPWKVYGFKFNFFASLDASQLSEYKQYLVENPVYLGLGAGVRVRNENLALNTLKIGGYYYPRKLYPMGQFYFEITTVVDFRFDIYGMRAPSFLQFR
ncbi:hypothetical protein [Chitinophaga lutea]|uniref:hypothetical protein n=1 Tax=Chitinophaga lutea TaxID=2488634 RepID=UPI000F4FB67A|nr:hypothetical protein [Chitinophaga lutea]